MTVMGSHRVRPLLVLAMLLAACSGEAAEPEGALVIYTTVTQETIDAVLTGFEAENPGVEVEVFRAPTGEVTARIAAELRDGELGADVLWLTDPLSIQQYDADGLLREWSPDDVDAVPSEYRSTTFFGTRILNMVIIAGENETVADWHDLEALGSVAIPDPSFAGSAFGALAYFALADGYGFDFYRALAENGVVQVSAPADVVTGVAEGLYQAGMTLDFSVREAMADGSPVQLVWPSSGAVAIYSPIAVVDSSTASGAEPFVEFVLSQTGQQAIADSGWQPIRADIEWEIDGDQVAVDWAEAFDRQSDLLGEYQSIFGN